MMSNSYLFQIPEIEEIILSYLEIPVDFYQLMLINKYFYEIVNNNIIFSEFKNFYKKEKFLGMMFVGYEDFVSYVATNVYEQINDQLYRKFLQACKYGYLRTAKYLLEKYIKTNDSVNNVLALLYCCKYGHLEIAQWLYHLDPKINIHANDELPFRLSCEKGHIEIAKWLYSIYGDIKINIHTNSESPFRLSCQNGHFEIAKWLYSIAGNIKIDIHQSSYQLEDYAFYMSCVNDHIEIAKWLYSLDNTINVRPVYEDISRNIVEDNQQEIKEWLKSLL